MNKAYHNKGFGVAFTWIIVLTMIVPLIGLMFIDDTWDRVVNNMLVHGLLSVGKIVNMNEYVVEIIIVNLDVTSV